MDKLSPELQTLKDKLKETGYTEELQKYLLSVAMNIERETNTLASFVPFNVELHIY